MCLTFLSLTLTAQSFIGHTKSEIIQELKSYSLHYTEEYSDKLGYFIEITESNMVQWVIFHNRQDVCVSEIYLPETLTAFQLFKESLDKQYEVTGYNRWKVNREGMILTIQLSTEDTTMFIVKCSNCSG
jgi:hypothetical protein